MGTTLASPSNTMDWPIYNALVPREGPRCVPFVVPFAAAPGPYLIDLQQMVAQRRMTVVQSCFIDNTGNPVSVSLKIGGSSQTVICPGNSQGYFPILTPGVPRFTVSSDAARDIQIIFINVPVPAAVWRVLDEALAGDLPAASLQSASIETPAPGSGPLIPAGDWSYVGIQAPLTADVWINLRGGAAGIGLPDCIRIPEGVLWQSANPCIAGGPVTYYCATAGLQLTCLYG